MEKPKWLTEAQWEEICNSVIATKHDVVEDQSDACRQVIRHHQQRFVMFEEVQSAILLI